MKIKLSLILLLFVLFACNGGKLKSTSDKDSVATSKKLSDTVNTRNDSDFSERNKEFKELESHIPRFYIKYKQPINGYSVKVMVESVDEPSRAILEFSKDGKVAFTLENRYFYESALEGDKKKIFKKGVYYVDYKIRKNERFSGDLDKGVPFFFQDVNFDNTKELVFSLWGQGQRHTSMYKVYSVNDNAEDILYQITDNEPFNKLDDFTKFDQKNKTITLFCDGGASNYTEFIYKLNNDGDDFVPLKKIVDTVDGEEIEYKIKVITSKKG